MTDSIFPISLMILRAAENRGEMGQNAGGKQSTKGEHIGGKVIFIVNQIKRRKRYNLFNFIYPQEAIAHTFIQIHKIRRILLLIPKTPKILENSSKSPKTIFGSSPHTSPQCIYIQVNYLYSIALYVVSTQVIRSKKGKISPWRGFQGSPGDP